MKITMKINNKKTRLVTKKFLLWLLKVGGIATLSIFNPQLPNELLKTYLKNRARLRERLTRLENRGWIKVSQRKDKFVIKLVKAGELKTLQFQLEDLKIKKPKKWDGNWRVVIFDIPNKKRLARNVLRDKLKKMGFFPLQKSVFVHSYPCRNEIEIIKNAYQIWPYVMLITTDQIDREELLKEKFMLE